VPRRLVNLALLAAIVTLLASGIVAWLLPDAAAGALYVTHRVAGIALVLALVWKYAIARRSLRRRGVRGSGVWIGLFTAVLTIAAAGLGLLWTVGLVSFDRPLAYSALNLHVIAGLALAVLVAAHALVRGESRETWRLRIRPPNAPPVDLSYADIVALPRHEASVVLDCTGGWWSEQVWSGVSLKDVLARSPAGETATRVEVISVTGHRWTFDRSEVEQAILATHVGGEPLTAGHGYPVRLVAPSLRGFLWIKWVGEVVVA